MRNKIYFRTKQNNQIKFANEIRIERIKSYIQNGHSKRFLKGAANILNKNNIRKQVIPTSKFIRQTIYLSIIKYVFFLLCFTF